MLIISTERNKKAIFDIFKKWDLEYSVIGKVNNNGYYSVYNHDHLLYNEHMDNFNVDNQDWKLTKFSGYSKISDRVKLRNKKLWEQYDSTIGCRTIKGPHNKGSYAILDIPEVNKQLVITWGEKFITCYGRARMLNAKPLCVVNCLNFGHPRDTMGDFVKVTKELSSLCMRYNVPIVGGNVSLYNCSDKVSIPPTPVLMMLSIK